MLILIATFVVGFIVGLLVARKHLDKVNLLVTEAKELAAKAEEELADFKRKQIKDIQPKKRGRKPAAKK
jgi:hypothetical protein